MAERIVSPGVFTREKDLSFLPQGISEIGAAIIGPTNKGPSYVPTIVRNFEEFEKIFGSYNSKYYTPYTVKNYLDSAGTVTIVKVGYLGGYSVKAINLLVSGSVVAATFAAAQPNNEGLGVITGTLGADAVASKFTLNIFGDSSAMAGVTASFSNLTLSEVGNLSGNSSNASSQFITKQLPSDPNTQKIGSVSAPFYMSHFFGSSISASLAVSNAGSTLPAVLGSVTSGSHLTLEAVSMSFDLGTETVSTADGNYIITNTGNKDAAAARTPYIQSQTPRTDLFRVYMRSDGTETNNYYVVIRDIKRPQNSNSSPEYAEFGIYLYKVGTPSSLESWSNLNMDPDSSNYLVRVIGDQFSSVNNDGEVTTYGDYPNLSSHIRIGDYKEDIFRSQKNNIPMGFAALNNPVRSASNVPTASFATTQTYNGVNNNTSTYVANLPYGFKIDSKYKDNELSTNKSYLAPIPSYGSDVSTGGNAVFSLENMYGYGTTSDSEYSRYTNFAVSASGLSISSSIEQLKFAVPMQFGFDGIHPAKSKKTGTSISATNTMGYDCSTSLTSGSVAWKRAINAVSNPDEYDINMLVTPGIIHKHHSVVSNHAIDKVEDRADCFYVLDGSDIDDNVATAVNNVASLDTNYVATYYPWVKMDDPAGNGQVWAPPSVVIPGVIAFTDRVAHEWFAPAGLNRGGLTNVRMTKKKLTHTDRDTLYEGRVNPIASFPGQGVVVFGQKTLQAKPSALDRINVRRLLIRLKKFIASSSRFLVFEQNDSSTRTRFLNIVNPFLESVQANSGLSAFKVVMDDSNNTPDVIDRNQLIGQIFIQPTRTAEFIVLDFTVMPTGAAFPE